MDRAEALTLVNSWVLNKNLVKHMLCVEAVMLALAHKSQVTNLKSQIWGLAGLLHDADYEKYPDKHPLVIIEELVKRDEDESLINAIRAHAWGYLPAGRQVEMGMPEPSNNMEWSLYCCDELTGLIVACALVRPDPPSHEASEGQAKNSKLHQVTVDSVLKKWKQKGFAAGVDRSQIGKCEEKLGIPLREFIEIALKAMQGISEELEL